MDVEIPKVMVTIEYPFPVKKSDLVSFTSGRALGSVLGMLEWLVDSLTVSPLQTPSPPNVTMNDNFLTEQQKERKRFIPLITYVSPIFSHLSHICLNF